MVLVASNTGENDSAPYFRSRFSSKLHVFLKTVRAKQKIDFFFFRQKATRFLKCFGIFPIPTLQAEAQRRGREGGRANNGREGGGLNKRGGNRGHKKQRDKKRVRLSSMELKQVVKRVSADMLGESRGR